MLRIIWQTPLALALCATVACGQSQDSAYHYEMVELPSEQRDIRDPNAQYRALTALALERAAQEATAGAEFSSAYVNDTYFGGKSDSLMAYAVTPVRGVYYYLPPGPYPIDGNTMSVLDNPHSVCRLIIEFPDFAEGLPPLMSFFEFVDKDCNPFPADPYEQAWEQEWHEGNLSAEFSVGETVQKDGFEAVRVFVQGGTGSKDPISSANAVLADSESTAINVLPLEGINEDSLAAVFASNGEILAVRDADRYDGACVIRHLTWQELVAEGRSNRPFWRACAELDRVEREAA